MQRAPQRPHIPKRRRHDAATSRRHTEPLQRLQAQVRQRFQDTVRPYHAVEDQWHNWRSAPTARSIQE